MSLEVDKISKMGRDLAARAQEAYGRVLANRESILEAFVAETGYLPSEIEQVEVHEGDTVRWFVRRREPVPSVDPDA